ncbi:DnaD/phage-associated family protein [Anaerobacterium chartisolvens]|uniref:DnaD/phage-associated family protein n=1 Tax=Anaerobacterium chartisolvens TaxID=1297424 RepID=A0A369B696_9FIRM|nr:DnaD domain protein [Anaerobacterium chartisolvens]RCX16066.1 DnaD/phage-associated family protein [Anaerobacterium chartisolvens]
MFFESYKSMLYSDTMVPDIFITEYMPSMDSDFVKIYMYCLFLSKHNKKTSTEEVCKKLEIDIHKVKSAFTFLESIGVIDRTNDGIVMSDLKEKEINKLYRLKTTSTPEEAALSSERNKKRNRIITAINNSFFQGVMSPSWYTDLDAWFDKYKFEEDVMYALFQHCYDHKGLSKNYIMKVADNWHNKNIQNSFDLDKYFIEYQKIKDIRSSIVKKLKLGRNLTEYEDEYVEKWVVDYKYTIEVIDLSLKKTTAKTNPNFKYVHAILTDWYERGLRTRDEVIAHEKSKKQNTPKAQVKSQAIPQKDNFEQRKHDDDYYNSFFNNVAGEK